MYLVAAENVQVYTESPRTAVQLDGTHRRHKFASRISPWTVERPISLGRAAVRPPPEYVLSPPSQFPSGQMCKLPPFLFLRAQAIGKLATILVLLKTSLTAPAVPPFPSCAASAPTGAPKVVQGAGASIGAPTFFLQVVERAGGISCTALSWIMLPRAKWSR